MRPVKTSFNKYESMMYTGDDLFTKPKSKLEYISDFLFGASESSETQYGGAQHKLGQGPNSLNLRNP